MNPMRLFPCFLIVFALLSCGQNGKTGSKADGGPSLSSVMDGVVTRLFENLSKEQLDSLDEAFILQFLTEEEKEVLSSRYWEFSVDQPVRVSIMRDEKQAALPFWLEASGFVKTGLSLRNEISTYEVWQKDFPKGVVSLGINGFDKHRPVYFVSVAPQGAGDPGQGSQGHGSQGTSGGPRKPLTLTPIFPEKQHIDTLRPGAFTYHDWDGLKLDEVPEGMVGELLLTTIRGRAREAHLIRAFRTTAYPSSDRPDQLVLTYDGDPASSIVVQWRSSPTDQSGKVVYWPENSSDTIRMIAEKRVLEDRLLYNDRYVSRFTARLENLLPGMRYGYYVENGSGLRSANSSFTTAADLGETAGRGETADPGGAARAGKAASPGTTGGFEFIWFGDTHNDAGWGETIHFADLRFPETAFYLHSGDLVNTGLHRDDWDLLFHYSGTAFGHAPLMAIPGNHDSQDGLGAWMFQQLLAYPANGPAGYPPGLTYSFRYENALFLMMDAASIPVPDQTEWIRTQLASSDADWKFLLVHFPPYNEVEPYPEIVENWSPVLEEYGVDMVMSGHFHYYMRTQPLKAGRIDSLGVTYLMSVGVSTARKARTPQPFVTKRVEQGNLFQRFQINGNTLQYTVYDKAGNELDRMTITK